MCAWVALIACGDDDGVTDASVADANGLVDTAVDVGANDAGGDAAVDAGATDAAADTNVDAGFGMSCEGPCAETSLQAVFGDSSELLDVAYFGFNADETLRIEAYGGAAEGCPEMDSPSPDRTLIIGALPAPVDRSEVTSTATLLDFEGSLTSEPFVSGPASVRGVAALLTPPEMSFVRVDFDVSFDGGTISGAIYATHCASLDE